MNEQSQEPVALYASRVKVHPQKISGTFRTVKWTVLGVILGLYYVIPWLRWDRGEGNADQMILIDMAGRRAYFFDLEIWPQEIYYLTGMLILGAVALFMATSLFGRVWCGFTCPQTLWTDLFMLVERWVEGDRNKRIKLDRAPMSGEKLLKRALKHAAWIVIAFLTGGAWILYFVDAPTATLTFFTGQGSNALYGMVFLFSATTYIFAGFGREQICTYMCPWPRFQGAMLDEHSMVVTYEAWRGEPRGARKKTETENAGLGDCVDCHMCVNVCPTGVDIRNGQQLSCIGCGLCIDACNSIMDKVGLPRGLVRYDSVANTDARAHGEAHPRTKFLRLRTAAYAALLLANVALIAWGLSHRSPLEINIQRDRSPMFVTLSDGAIRNGYTLKLLNMVREPHTYRLKVDGIEGALITVADHQEDPAEEVALDVKPDSVGTFHVFVRATPDNLQPGSNPLTFEITVEETGSEAEESNVFYGP